MQLTLIIQEATLHLVLRLRGGGDGTDPADSETEITVQIQSSAAYLHFEDAYSLMDLKKRIYRRTGIPPERQTLSHNGIELFDCNSIPQYLYLHYNCRLIRFRFCRQN